MFAESVQLHYTSATAKTETHNDVTTAVTAVSLVLDSLTPGLAGELSDEIAELCFADKRIRDAMTQLKVRLREPQQKVTIKMATDSRTPHVVLRHVRVPSVRISKRGEDPNEEVERKSKKVAPTGETLRATLDCLVLPESNDVRQFLLMMAGRTFQFEFEDEQEQLDFADDDDDSDDNGPKEQPLDFTERAQKAKPIKDVEVVAALAENQVELKGTVIARMTPAQRGQVLAWAADCRIARDQNEATPAPPSFILNPSELTPPREAKAPTQDGSEAKKPKAEKPANHWKSKRQAKNFTNPPRIAKAKKKGK